MTRKHGILPSSEVIAREYFRVMGEANRKNDPNHLIFRRSLCLQYHRARSVGGNRCHGLTPSPFSHLFNPGFPRRSIRRFTSLPKSQSLICDFAIRFKDGDKSIRGWQLKDRRPCSRRVHYAEYIRAALETPYIIGAFWCNPVDSTPAFNRGGGLKQGLFGDGLTPRPGLSEAVIELNRHIAQVTPDRADAPQGGRSSRSEARTGGCVTSSQRDSRKATCLSGQPPCRPRDPRVSILAQEFSYITPANDFKQTYIHPEPDQVAMG